MSKIEKQKFRNCDYYSFMSLADFMAWVEADEFGEPRVNHV